MEDYPLTPNFKLSEMLDCRAEYQERNNEQGQAYIENMRQVCRELEKLREYIFRPITISSGFRCHDLNVAVGGAGNSQHLYGLAADFTVKDFDDHAGLYYIFSWCGRNLNHGQLIFERPAGKRPWIHIGMPREGRAPAMFIFENGIYRRI